NTRTRWGRRRPWLILGTPALILTFVLFFMSPDWLGENSGFVYVLLMYCLVGSLDSLLNASYGALFPELFREDSLRAKVNAMRQMFNLLAMAIGIAVTPMVVEKIGYSTTALIYGGVAWAVIWYCAAGCHECGDWADSPKPPFFRSILDLLRLKQFWIFGAAGAFYSAAFSLIMQAVPFFAQYALKVGGTEQTMLIGVVFGVALLGVLFWSTVISRKKMAALTAWRSSFILMSAGFVVMYFFGNDLMSVMAIAPLIALGAGGSMTTMDVIGAKIIDEDYRRHGIRREGLISSIGGILNRLNSLYSGFAFIMLEKIFGFVDGNKVGDNPALASRWLFIGFPLIAMLLCVVFALILRFNEEEGDVRENSNANTPE
ncbi:MAG: MFS transporter, partial [Oscillospiraceae bacterium]|nr:MFS transporter [Oscillospiraceae bacterium]